MKYQTIISKNFQDLTELFEISYQQSDVNDSSNDPKYLCLKFHFLYPEALFHVISHHKA